MVLQMGGGAEGGFGAEGGRGLREGGGDGKEGNQFTYESIHPIYSDNELTVILLCFCPHLLCSHQRGVRGGVALCHTRERCVLVSGEGGCCDCVCNKCGHKCGNIIASSSTAS